jgi:hypothetical protein
VQRAAGRRRAEDEKGQAIALLIVALPALLAAMAFALNMALLHEVRLRLDQATSFAALTGADSASHSATSYGIPTLSPSVAEATVHTVFGRNLASAGLPSNAHLTTVTCANATPTRPSSADGRVFTTPFCLASAQVSASNLPLAPVVEALLGKSALSVSATESAAPAEYGGAGT